MAKVDPIQDGYKITDAQRFGVNLVLSPAYGPSVYKATFLRSSAVAPKQLGSTLTRNLTGGMKEFYPLPVDQETMGDLEVPMGVFAGRKVTWSVVRSGLNRVLTVTVDSRDTLGVYESWYPEMCVNKPVGGYVTVSVTATPPQALITGVNVVA